MKKLCTLLLLSLFLSSAQADYWTQKASFSGSNRIGCFSFSIGNKGYVGCGYDTSWATSQKFWEYDQLSNIWTQKADFAGPSRVYATGFSISGYGYAGLGVDPAAGWMNDFWKYDPAANAWSSIDSFPGGGRSEACSFVVNNKAYVGTGTGTVAPYIFNDLWEYNPVTNAWTAKASFPGQARSKAMGFADGNYGYIVTGFASVNYYIDMYQYDPVTNSWVPQTNFPADPRGGAAGFSLSGLLYIGTGLNHPATGSAYASNDWWQYEPATNQWKQKTSFTSNPRYETGYFPINNKGYIGIGVQNNIQYSDFWEYSQGAPAGMNEFTMYNIQYTISPNPAKELLVINYTLTGRENLEITIIDVQGNKVFQSCPNLFDSETTIKVPLGNLRAGLYFVELTNGKEKTVKKFLKN